MRLLLSCVHERAMKELRLNETNKQLKVNKKLYSFV